MQRKIECKEKSLKNIVGIFILGNAFGLLVGLVCLLAISFFASLIGSVSFEVMTFLASVPLVICAFTSGFVAAKGVKRKGLVVGVFSSVLLFFIIFIIGCIFFNLKLNVNMIPRFVMLLIFSVLGGIVGVNK